MAFCWAQPSNVFVPISNPYKVIMYFSCAFVNAYISTVVLPFKYNEWQPRKRNQNIILFRLIGPNRGMEGPVV